MLITWTWTPMVVYMKQTIQHGVRKNVLACSAADIDLLIYSDQAYVSKR